MPLPAFSIWASIQHLEKCPLPMMFHVRYIIMRPETSSLCIRPYSRAIVAPV
jgi:hypothetical protein